MRMLFYPAMMCLRPLYNEVKFPLLALLFITPTLIVYFFDQWPLARPLALGIYGFVCYVLVAQYFIVADMWVVLLDMMRSINTGSFTIAGANRVGGQYATAYRSMTKVIDNISEIVTQARSSAERISGVAKEIASGNVNLSQRTEEQASMLEETASGMEQLSANVKQNADNCALARTLADRADNVATRGSEMVGKLVDTMGLINKSSNKVSDIIGAIENIAFQTSILALNAAVEAERAGDQGRGFAVVAAEVRSLAARSAAAAKEIKILIGESVDNVGQGSKLVDEAGRIISEVVSSVQEVTQRIGKIASASEEQAAGVVEINRAIVQMEHVTQQNAALVEEAAATSAAFEEEAGKVEATLMVFNRGRDKSDPSAINPTTSR